MSSVIPAPCSAEALRKGEKAGIHASDYHSNVLKNMNFQKFFNPDQSRSLAPRKTKIKSGIR